MKSLIWIVTQHNSVRHQPSLASNQNKMLVPCSYKSCDSYIAHDDIYYFYVNSYPIIKIWLNHFAVHIKQVYFLLPQTKVDNWNGDNFSAVHRIKLWTPFLKFFLISPSITAFYFVELVNLANDEFFTLSGAKKPIIIYWLIYSKRFVCNLYVRYWLYFIIFRTYMDQWKTGFIYEIIHRNLTIQTRSNKFLRCSF